MMRPRDAFNPQLPAERASERRSHWPRFNLALTKNKSQSPRSSASVRLVKRALYQFQFQFPSESLALNKVGEAGSPGPKPQRKFIFISLTTEREKTPRYHGVVLFWNKFRNIIYLIPTKWYYIFSFGRYIDNKKIYTKL